MMIAQNLRKIPLCIVVGFLGSGKTTFLRHLIKTQAHQRVLYIVNEYSSEDVDGAVLKQHYKDVMSLTGGSVFCKCLAGQFIGTLKSLAERFTFSNCDGIVVEASGIANPESVGRMLFDSGLDSHYFVSTVIAVIDPGMFPVLLEKFPNVKSQIYAADIIILNKCDVYEEEQITKAEGIARIINSQAVFYRAIRCEVSLCIFNKQPRSKSDGEYAGERDPRFFTIAVYPDEHVDVEKFCRVLQSYNGILYRAKGFLATVDGSVYLDWTPTTRSVFELPNYTREPRFVLIGANDNASVIKTLAMRLQQGAYAVSPQSEQ